MSLTGGKVAIITGGSQGIGASLVAAYRRRGWSVVATARSLRPTEDPDVLTVDGDIADPATADRIIGGALERFGRIDTLVNNAGVYISKGSLASPTRHWPSSAPLAASGSTPSRRADSLSCRALSAVGEWSVQLKQQEMSAV